ncbi:MAG: hypothetical protein KAR20_27040 [Candidatus Heimdallarchaeota archaeon]|nr:hypothetical protein [Candidatus Heimdallarchaeota archaeon]
MDDGEKNYKVTKKQLESLLSYLSSRPYREVVNVIKTLGSLTEIEEVKDK